MCFNEAAYKPFPYILVEACSASGTLRWSPLGPYLMCFSWATQTYILWQIHVQLFKFLPALPDDESGKLHLRFLELNGHPKNATKQYTKVETLYWRILLSRKYPLWINLHLVLLKFAPPWSGVVSNSLKNSYRKLSRILEGSRSAFRTLKPHPVRSIFCALLWVECTQLKNYAIPYFFIKPFRYRGNIR